MNVQTDDLSPEQLTAIIESMEAAHAEKIKMAKFANRTKYLDLVVINRRGATRVDTRERPTKGGRMTERFKAEIFKIYPEKPLLVLVLEDDEMNKLFFSTFLASSEAAELIRRARIGVDAGKGKTSITGDPELASIITELLALAVEKEIVIDTKFDGGATLPESVVQPATFFFEVTKKIATQGVKSVFALGESAKSGAKEVETTAKKMTLEMGARLYPNAPSKLEELRTSLEEVSLKANTALELGLDNAENIKQTKEQLENERTERILMGDTLTAKMKESDERREAEMKQADERRKAAEEVQAKELKALKEQNQSASAMIKSLQGQTASSEATIKQLKEQYKSSAATINELKEQHEQQIHELDKKNQKLSATQLDEQAKARRKSMDFKQLKEEHDKAQQTIQQHEATMLNNSKMIEELQAHDACFEERGEKIAELQKGKLENDGELSKLRAEMEAVVTKLATYSERVTKTEVQLRALAETDTMLMGQVGLLKKKFEQQLGEVKTELSVIKAAWSTKLCELDSWKQETVVNVFHEFEGVRGDATATAKLMDEARSKIADLDSEMKKVTHDMDLYDQQMKLFDAQMDSNVAASDAALQTLGEQLQSHYFDEKLEQTQRSLIEQVVRTHRKSMGAATEAGADARKALESQAALERLLNQLHLETKEKIMGVQVDCEKRFAGTSLSAIRRHKMNVQTIHALDDGMVNDVSDLEEKLKAQQTLLCNTITMEGMVSRTKMLMATTEIGHVREQVQRNKAEYDAGRERDQAQYNSVLRAVLTENKMSDTAPTQSVSEDAGIPAPPPSVLSGVLNTFASPISPSARRILATIITPSRLFGVSASAEEAPPAEAEVRTPCAPSTGTSVIAPSSGSSTEPPSSP